MKTFIRKMAARNAEIVYNPSYEGKGRHKDFYNGKWPRAARKCFIRLFIKEISVITTSIKGTGRAQRGNFLKS